MCEQSAQFLDTWISYLWLAHFVLLLITFYKEVYEAKQNSFSKFMLAMQVLGLLFLFYSMLRILEFLILVESRQNQMGIGIIKELRDKGFANPVCYTDKELVN
jgi:hypothetical protein